MKQPFVKFTVIENEAPFTQTEDYFRVTGIRGFGPPNPAIAPSGAKGYVDLHFSRKRIFVVQSPEEICKAIDDAEKQTYE